MFGAGTTIGLVNSVVNNDLSASANLHRLIAHDNIEFNVSFKDGERQGGETQKLPFLNLPFYIKTERVTFVLA